MMPYIPENNYEDYVDITPTSAKVLTYYEDKECTDQGGKLECKYTKEVTYSFVNADCIYQKMIKDALDNNESCKYEVKMLIKDKNTTSTTKVYLNPDYDPKKYRELCKNPTHFFVHEV